MLSRRKVIRTLRIFPLTVAGSALVTFAYSQGDATQAGLMSGKWVSPALSAAKKNPIAPSQTSLAAGQKIYLKRCAACHGKTGNGDGHDAADLGIYAAKISETVIREERTSTIFWKITNDKKRK